MLHQKLRGERLALQRFSGPSVVLVAFLIPVAYYNYIAPSSLGASVTAVPPALGGEAGGDDNGPDAAARARFETVFAAYLQRHAAATALLDAPQADPKAASALRLVVAPVCREGLGNRLPGLVTAFALALLTDRVLLIDDAVGKFYGLFSPAFDCNYTQGRQAAAEALPGFKEERLRAGRVEAAFLLEDLGRKYRDVTALRYEGCDYQLPLLQANEHHRRFLNGLAPCFGVLGAPLFRPEQDLAAEATDLYAANVPPGSMVVGTHIRLHKRGSYMPPVRWYADTALAVGLRRASPDRLRFFIAADDSAAVEEFKAAVTQTLAHDWNVTGGAAAVFQRPGRRDPRTALVDMLMLGMSNETGARLSSRQSAPRVITYGSSFGYVATALTLRPPHYQQHLYQDHVYQDSPAVAGRAVEPHERVADDHVFFWKAVVAEPCYWDSKGLLTGAFSGSDAALHDRLVAAFRSNVYWQQYSQCHWATARACGNVTCAEKEGRG